VETLEERADWVRIRYRDGEGWVKRRSLRFVADDGGGAVRQNLESRAARREEARQPEPAASAPAPPRAPEPAPEAPGPNPVAAQPSPVATPVPAAPPPPPKPAEPGGYLSGFDRDPEPPRTGGSGIFSVVSSLLLVLALVAGAVWVFRTFSGRRSFGPQKGRGIQILATRALGPRQGLVLVEVGGLPLLLAQGEGGVHLITEIQDPEALRRLNDLYGFRQTPFEAELHRQLDLETPDGSEDAPMGDLGARGPSPVPEPDGGPSAEERLAALRRRRKAGEEL
jgi:flagellar biosynthetic protein FliO